MEKAQTYQLIKSTITNHFPEINYRRLKILFVHKMDYYMAAGWFFRYRLFIDKSALKFSEDAFKGCLGHELAHMLQMKEKGFINRFLFRYRERNITEEERDADLRTIKRGLGSELLKFHTEHNKRYKSYKKSEGLTREEIKRLLKEVNI